MTDQPDVAPFVALIDCDTDELHHFTQLDGSKAEALLVEHCVESAAIDLDEVFRETES